MRTKLLAAIVLLLGSCSYAAEKEPPFDGLKSACEAKDSEACRELIRLCREKNAGRACYYLAAMLEMADQDEQSLRFAGRACRLGERAGCELEETMAKHIAVDREAQQLNAQRPSQSSWESLDLTPAAALVDQWTGSRFTETYRPPRR